MNIVRWQPAVSARPAVAGAPLEMEMERIFNWALGGDQRASRSMVPALDVIEQEQRYLVRADLPGLGRDEVEVTFQDGVLSIKGEKKPETRPETHRQHLRERFEGNFVRNLRLPEKVDAEKIEATMKDGVLELVLPFVPEAQPRKIQVNG